RRGDRLPHPALERRSPGRERQIERGPLSREIRNKLRNASAQRCECGIAYPRRILRPRVAVAVESNRREALLHGGKPQATEWGVDKIEIHDGIHCTDLQRCMTA